MKQPPSPKYWRTNEFKALRAKWYAKLAEKGFKDIEYTNIDKLKYTEWEKVRSRQTAHQAFSKKENIKHRITEIESVTEYYQAASKFLYDYKWESRLHKAIWLRHSQGIDVTSIAEELGLTYEKTRRIVEKHRDIMLGDRI